MAMALSLGARGVGRTAPNPFVGCVIVRHGKVVGRGWTQPGGRPHAETEALRRAGPAARGATAYVTLEPCANWGRTPPCAKAIIEAGVERVVVACGDPDPRVDGRGLAWLRAAGIATTTGILETEALAAHGGLYRRIHDHRPHVTLKIAASADGRIATRGGQSRWITGAAARAVGHRLRAQHDAILIGSGTAIADDPQLTCRLPGEGAATPTRVVLDRRLRLPLDSAVVRGAPDLPLWIVTVTAQPRAALDAFTALGCSIVRLEPGAEDVASVLAALARRGITRLLVEGGAGLATSLMRQRLVDELYLFTAPIMLGADALAPLAALGLAAVDGAMRWHIREARALPPDHLLVLVPSTE